MSKNVNGIKPFKFFSQKVLPLVYDDSLSYYEVLCKLTNKINELVEFINGKVADLVKQILAEGLFDAMYIEEEECIVLKSNIIQVEDGVHTFDPSSKTMTIKGE